MHSIITVFYSKVGHSHSQKETQHRTPAALQRDLALFERARGGHSGSEPLASPCFVLCFIGMETEVLFDYEKRTGSCPL